MGVKRPLREENLPELSFKQPKQLDDTNETSTFMTPNLTTAFPRKDSLGDLKSKSCELHIYERLESGETPCASTEGRESEASLMRMGDGVGTFSAHEQLDSSNEKLEANRDEDDTGNVDTSFMHNFPEYTNFSIPWQPPHQFKDPYVFLLNSSPRKEVLVGPDYQVEVQSWEPRAGGQKFSASSNFVENEREQNQMGTCIIPMPDSNCSIPDESLVGRGRLDCSCPDVDSKRCVQQHVKEVRENLRVNIGDKTFGMLGFYDMGEEVSRKWTADEEQHFHEVVFSSPASHGRDFWEYLSFVFPNRTKKEIVSYYFNVFMLRRRGVQNRSDLLSIDSDDDEKQESVDGEHFQIMSLRNQDSDAAADDDLNGTHEEFYLVGEEYDYLAVKSFRDQDLVEGLVYKYGPWPENAGGEEGSDKIRGTGDRNDFQQDNVEMDGGKAEFWRRCQEVKYMVSAVDK